MEKAILSFNKLFAHYLEISEYNLSTLAKATGIERTKLTKYRGGKNLPKDLETVNIIADHLSLNNKEREQFIQSYHSDTKSNNHIIKDEMLAIIKDISTPLSRNSNLFSTHSEVNSSYPLILNNTYEVVSFINFIITSQNKSNGTIKMFLPFSFTMAFDGIKIIYSLQESNSTIQHIIQLDNSNRKLSKNMFSISQMLLLSFNLNGKYEPKYTYENTDITANLPLITPYYIITSDYIILISKDYNSAVVLDDKSVIDFYSDKFNTNFNSLSSAINSFGSVKLITDQYNKHFNDTYLVSAIEPLPCLLILLDSKFLRSKLKEDFEKTTSYFKYFDNNRTKLSEVFTSYFTHHGLNLFVTEGKTNIYPDEFYHPFTLEERLYALKRLKNLFLQNSNSPRFVMLKDSVFSENSSISITLFQENILVFTNAYNSNMSLVNLNIPYFNQEFSKFMLNLSESIYVHSNSETLSIVDNYIEVLEKQLEN